MVRSKLLKQNVCNKTKIVALNLTNRKMNQPRQEVEPTTAYILWALCFVGICGVHRFYSGKTISGLLYLFTVGFFGFGQLIDLLLIPGMTRERNMYLMYQATVAARNNGHQVTLVEPTTAQAVPKKEQDPMLLLLKTAADHNNVLSVGQAMLSTEMPLEQIEELLQQALKQGLAHIDNDDRTGAVRYHFDV